MAIVHTSDPSTEPHESIRTDLWSEMSVQELVKQQELLVSHTLNVQSMMDAQGTSLTVMNMYQALTQAAAQLSALIDTKGKGNFNA